MIIVRARSSPFEVMFMVAALLAGATILVIGKKLGTAANMQLPFFVTVIFGAGLMFGSGTVLLGLAMKTLWGTFLERAGLTALSMLMVVYAVLYFDYYGIRAIITALFFLSFAVASGWRFFQIGRELNDVEKNIIVGDAVRSMGPTEPQE